jgi:pSer/pThr/pTyr-binding forkhead associated (FHA) protein
MREGTRRQDPASGRRVEAVMFRLTLNFAGKPIRKFNFNKETVCIGRDPDCEILIDNIGVSRRHATIERANGEYILTDLKSHNGTFVRGQRIYHHQLGDGDEFFIGKYSLSFENLDVETQDPKPQEESDLNAAGMQDMTFRLDKGEIERIMGASTTGSVPKLALLAPEKEQTTVLLEDPYFLVGADDSAGLKISGFLMPPFVAVLVRNDKWFHVVSLSRRFPVTVHGMKVTDHQLADGEVFQIGKRKFRFAST